MIFSAFFQALGQLGDRRFRRVALLGILLTLALLVAAYAAFLQLLWWLAPDSFELPIVGPVTGIKTLLGWASFFFMLGLSVFLMVPVAAAFTGLFLEDVVDAVEDRHYPFLPPATALPWGQALRQGVNFLGVILAVNTVAVLAYPLAGLAAPLLFWVLNGLLLGWEFFSLVALRRMSKPDVRAMRWRNLGTLWLAGMLMAAPLSVPLVNLLIPLLGVATFTHIFHRLARSDR